MFSKISIFMMLLLVTASLVGISSIDKPAKLNAQPQTLQPPQGAQILGRAQPPANTGIVTSQLQENAQLAERLFPFIVQKLDGKTLAQKIDATTLVQKMNAAQLAALLQKVDGRTLAALLQKADGQLLAQKILPFLDVNVVTLEGPGQSSAIDITGPLNQKTSTVKASCPPEESLVGGAIEVHNMADLDVFRRSNQPGEENSWVIISTFDGDGRLRSYAECLRAEVTLKGPQQPIPAPPPGGPPLQPPPNLR